MFIDIENFENFIAMIAITWNEIISFNFLPISPPDRWWRHVVRKLGNWMKALELKLHLIEAIQSFSWKWKFSESLQRARKTREKKLKRFPLEGRGKSLWDSEHILIYLVCIVAVWRTWSLRAVLHHVDNR